MRTSGLLSDSTGIIQRVKTVLVGERPLELEAYLERRHALGQDRFDETWETFDFYARCGVDEICTAEPFDQRLRWWILVGPTYEETDFSSLLGIRVDELAAQIEWPRA